MRGSEALLTVAGLTVEFAAGGPPVRANHDVSFEVEAGRATLLAVDNLFGRIEIGEIVLSVDLSKAIGSAGWEPTTTSFRAEKVSIASG